MTQYRYINKPGSYMCDLIELNESQYIEINHQTGYIFIMYNPANHLIFLRYSKTKQAEVMTNFLKEFIDYLDDNKNKIEITLFDHLTMDDGSEFKSDFTELLEQEQIKIRRLNPNKNDYKMLSQLNIMCRFVRNQIIKRFVSLDKDSQTGKKELKILITVPQINKILKEITQNHNFERVVKPYNKKPCEINLDEIEQYNEIKRQQNGEVDQKYKYKLGDRVRITLQKQLLQKGRHQKYSDGEYKVIGKDQQHYMLTPENFNLERYKHYFQIDDKQICGVPVYFRKSYEMKPVDPKQGLKQGLEQGLYYPAEQSESKHYVFDKILKSNVKEFDMINKNTKYLIQVGKKEFSINIAQIRNERFELSDAEKKYWFGDLYNEIQLDSFTVRI